MYAFTLREFLKTPVILTPGAVTVGCEPQFVLHFRGIQGIRRRAQKSCFGGTPIAAPRSGDLKRQKSNTVFDVFLQTSMKIDDIRCTVVLFHEKSISIVVLSLNIGEHQ